MRLPSLRRRPSLAAALLAIGLASAGSARAQAGAGEADAGADAERADADSVAVEIASPSQGGAVSAAIHQARITGSAIANARVRHFDVMLAIDVSHSTRTASGADVDGDGMVGVDPFNELLPPGAIPRDVRSTDPEDTILHAQVAAARTLMANLDPRRVRIGVISFSGEVNPVTGERKAVDQQDAWLEMALTDDYALVHRTLQSILARGPHGATNFAAGVRLGVVELAALTGAQSRPRPSAEKVILFLTDGTPTFPVGKGRTVDPGDVEAAIHAAELASRAGIHINTYAIGPNALKYPRAVTEMARVSRGTYTPVQHAGDIITLLAGTTFADVEDVVLANMTTGDLSTDVRLHPDGSFTGYLPVREGTNRVRVIALSSDGRRGAQELEFEFSHREVGDREQLAELERIRRQNRDLEVRRMKVEIDRFREEQRRRVEITVGDSPDEGAAQEPPGTP